MQSMNAGEGNEGWRVTGRETRFSDDHLAVVTETVETPTRPPRPWTVVHRKSAVVIAAETKEGKFLLLRQERVPLRTSIWEMPAGQIDGKAEPSEDEIRAAAERELEEETGFRLTGAGELIPLGDYFSSPGFTDEQGYFFLARGIEREPGHEFDKNEGILECRAFSAAEISRMIAANEIRDANTLGICARMAARGLFGFEPTR